MASNKLKVQAFRANDLDESTGKQFELGSSWCEFFEIDDSVGDISFTLSFKPLIKAHETLKDRQIELKLSGLTPRRDRKAYANGSNSGHSAIKEFFLNELKLTLKDNSSDYFAIYKASEFDFYLYYIPKLLHDNFIKLFESIAPNVTIHKLSENERNYNKNLQQVIYFGAPGTGKSFEINRITKNKQVIRTTFHPDSDYSTFVGAYKPTSIEIPVRDVTGKVIVENGKQVTENRIVYEFVEQAFLQAYIKAWNAYAEATEGEKAEEQYLVIEEINRGNCAQIFGDLFQLLDRNGYGFSEYPISADKDMKKQLAKAFKGMAIADAERINQIYGKDIVSKVLSGEILLLPDNLFIWATMNTSDQSLFPIDSAFKRRWDWKYIPICEGKENGVSLGWKIKVNGKLFDWWQFVEKINAEINELTKSEDKKLGYFFCKAQDGIVTAETFVSKVVFYLWNDVFKDQDVASIFNDGDEELSFSNFYDTDVSGKAIVKEDKVEVLLKNLRLEPVSTAEVQGDKDSPSSDLLVKYKGVTIEGTSSISKYIEIINRVVEEKGVEVVGNCLGADLTQTPPDNTRNFKEIGNTGWYLATHFGTAKMKVNLNKIESSLGVGIVIEES